MGEVNILGGSWLKLNVYKVFVTLNFIMKYGYYMFWYFKCWGSIEWSVLFNITSPCLKEQFFGPGFSLLNTEDN